MNYQAAIHHKIEADGVEYVYMTSSAAVLRLDSVSSGILDQFSTEGGVDATQWETNVAEHDDAEDYRSTFAEMVAMGMLRPTDDQRIPSDGLPPMPFPLASLVLNVTNKCNLSCTYCYEYGEDKLPGQGGQLGRSPMMSEDTAKQSVDFLFESAGGRPAVTLTFFGGETLLNFGTIKAAVLHARERAVEAGKGVNFSLTTNATLLTDEVIEFLVENRFGVNISIDGDEGAQDRHRVFKSGRGSYEEIAPRIQKLLKRNTEVGGRPIGARVTLTRGTSGVREIYDHLVGELGFNEVGFAPVTSSTANDYALKDPDYQRVLDEFGELSEDFTAAALKGEHHGFSNMTDLLNELHKGVNKAHPCGAGLGLLGVSTEGKLGLCHRFVESGEQEVGSIEEGVDEERRAQFLSDGHIDKKVECHTCFARPVCSGGCYHEALVRYGDAAHPNLHYCDWIRSWTDLGLQTYARIMNGNPSWFDALEKAS